MWPVGALRAQVAALLGIVLAQVDVGQEARLSLLALHLPVLVEAGRVGAARRRDERPAVQVQQVLQRSVDFEHHAASSE